MHEATIASNVTFTYTDPSGKKFRHNYKNTLVATGWDLLIKHLWGEHNMPMNATNARVNYTGTGTLPPPEEVQSSNLTVAGGTITFQFDTTTASAIASVTGLQLQHGTGGSAVTVAEVTLGTAQPLQANGTIQVTWTLSFAYGSGFRTSNNYYHTVGSGSAGNIANATALMIVGQYSSIAGRPPLRWGEAVVYYRDFTGDAPSLNRDTQTDWLQMQNPERRSFTAQSGGMDVLFTYTNVARPTPDPSDGASTGNANQALLRVGKGGTATDDPVVYTVCDGDLTGGSGTTAFRVDANTRFNGTATIRYRNA